MPRPLRKPNEVEQSQFDIIRDINQTIIKNIDRNKALSEDRRERVKGLLADGWSMYGVALQTGLTPNTIKRIVE